MSTTHSRSTLLINGYTRLHIEPVIQSIIPNDLQIIFAAFYGSGTWAILIHKNNFRPNIQSLSLVYDHHKIKDYNFKDKKQIDAPFTFSLAVCYADLVPMAKYFDDNFTHKCRENNISNPSAVIECTHDRTDLMYSALVFDKDNHQNTNTFRHTLATNYNAHTVYAYYGQHFKYSNINYSLYSVVGTEEKINIFNLDLTLKRNSWNLLYSSDVNKLHYYYENDRNRNYKLELINNDSCIWISTKYQSYKTACHMYNLQDNEWLNGSTLNAKILSNTCYSNHDQCNDKIYCYTSVGIYYYELNANKWFKLCDGMTDDPPVKVVLWYGDNCNTLYYALETIDDSFVYYTDLRCKNEWTMDDQLRKILDVPYFTPIAF